MTFSLGLSRICRIWANPGQPGKIQAGWEKSQPAGISHGQPGKIPAGRDFSRLAGIFRGHAPPFKVMYDLIPYLAAAMQKQIIVQQHTIRDNSSRMID
jgi:hypothetical protein